MTKFEAARYAALSEQELKAAKLVLALAVTPLFFFLSSLGNLGTLSCLTKTFATISVLGFASGTLLWGGATIICQLAMVSVEYERAKGMEGDALRAFTENAWTNQNNLTSKLFWPAAWSLVVGFTSMSIFVLLVIWAP